MELRQLETFALVAEEGRCVAAARRLSVSPATVTARLDRLEGSLGVRLLRRRTRHVGLTPAGARLLPEIQELLRAVVELRQRAERVRAGQEGVLRIAALAHRRGTAVRLAGLLRRAVPGWEVQITVVGRRAMLDVFRDELAEIAVGRVRAPRSEVRRVGIGGRSWNAETIAWREELPQLPAAAIARIAERLGTIVRRRVYRGPMPEMRWLSRFFTAVDRLLVPHGPSDAADVSGGDSSALPNPVPVVVDSASVGLTGMEPTSVGPTGVEPTSVGPTGVKPANREPTGADPTRAGTRGKPAVRSVGDPISRRRFGNDDEGAP